MKHRVLQIWLVFLAVTATPAIADDDARPEIVYSHGFSYIEGLKYPADFPHFDYVNPDAPKGGLVRTPESGTWDTFNGILDKGRIPLPVRRIDHRVLIYDRLLEQAIDESESWYGRLAEGVWAADDYSQFAFKLREGAKWHDGEPVTVEDVIFTFMTMKEVGAAGVRSALYELDTAEQIGPREVLFTTKPGAQNNPDLVIMVGQYSVLPKHFWESRDITKTTIEPPLGSGPYYVDTYQLGRNIVVKRDPDYWGKDLPVNKGRYNFDRLKWDYFRDESVQLEALKGDVIDVRHETVSKNWMTAYEFPAVNAGYLKRELVDLSRPWGLWAPVFWNLNKPKFQDVRVREALWLLSEFNYYNRVLMFGFYNYAKSYFYNSDMASSGLPSAKELELLEPLRGQIPDRVFTEEWVGNETSGYGFDRENVDRSIALFKEAGWEIVDGVMTNAETGEAFTIDFVFESPFALRQETPLMGMLNMVGIETTARTLEYSNWLYRMRNALFDGSTQTAIPSNMPGIFLRNQYGSASARSEGGQNWGRIQDPAVDILTEHVMAARTPDDFYAATRAIDRVLLWNFYRIPGLGVPGYRLVHWDRFGIPENQGRLLRESWLDTWWWDEDKAERVRVGMEALTGK